MTPHDLLAWVGPTSWAVIAGAAIRAAGVAVKVGHDERVRQFAKQVALWVDQSQGGLENPEKRALALQKLRARFPHVAPWLLDIALEAAVSWLKAQKGPVLVAATPIVPVAVDPAPTTSDAAGLGATGGG